MNRNTAAALWLCPALVLGLANSTQAQNLDFAPPGLTPYFGQDVGDTQIGVSFTAVTTFSIDSAGIKFNPFGNQTSQPNTYELDVYIYGLTNGIRGPLLATGSRCQGGACPQTTLFPSDGVPGTPVFFDVPVTFTFLAGQSYLVEFGVQPGGWGEGDTAKNWVEFYRFDPSFPDAPPYSRRTTFTVGPARVLDGAFGADFGNQNFVHIRLGEVAPRVARLSVTPEAVTVGSATVITVGVAVSAPDAAPVVPGSVKLLQIRIVNGVRHATVLATLNDDGVGGDRTAGDSIYGGTATVDISSIGLIVLQVSASFQNRPAPVLSPEASVEVFPATVPLANQAADLSIGNLCTDSGGTTILCRDLLMFIQPGASISGVVQPAASSVGGTLIGVTHFPWENVWELRVPCATATCVDSLCSILKAESTVLSATPDVVGRVTQLPAPVVPNDPFYGSQYGPPLVRLDLAWNFTTGLILPAKTAVPKIAIVDSGIDGTVPDLSAAAGKTVVGNNWINNNGTATNDECGHGTQVAGVAAAAGNNGMQIAGASWDAVLIAIKDAQPFIDAMGNPTCGGVMSKAIKALKQGVDLGGTSINYSAGFMTTRNNTRALADAVEYINDANRVLVAAAGNGNTNVKEYPAGLGVLECFPNFIGQSCFDTLNISVGAVNAQKIRSAFSNYGDWVQVYAPGENILTTAKAMDPCLTAAGVNPMEAAAGLCRVDGTSFAAPLVAGIASLAISANPRMGAQLPRIGIRAFRVSTGRKAPDGTTVFLPDAFTTVKFAATGK